MADDGGASAVDIASSVGTWVAAALAIIALVGIVGPFFALQASLSDSNRAMNAVQDRPQKYITRGYRLTRGLRIFRRIRVPNLSRGYISNEPDDTPLMPLSAALGHFEFTPGDYLPWNTGWAKLAEMIAAYSAHDPVNDKPVPLGVPQQGGAFEVVNSRTALVVNKHWILLLGLLGRYGKRSDGGVLQNRGVRRDFGGERGSIRHFGLLRKEAMSKVEPVRKKMLFYEKTAMVRRRRASSGSISSADSETDSSSDDERVSLRRTAYGEWVLDSRAQPSLHGVTGTIKGLGRHKGSWSYLTSVSFVPHTAREIFPRSIQTKRESSSMQTLFWLAHGFLPAGRTPEGRQIVISMEDPASGMDSRDVVHSGEGQDSWTFFTLTESDDIPISLGHSMKHLGIPEPMVLQFLPVDRTGGIQQPHVHSTPALQKTFVPIKPGTPWSAEMEAERQATIAAQMGPTFDVQGQWLFYNNGFDGVSWSFLRAEVERPLSIVLNLDWDEWGFMLWKDRFWISLLQGSTAILCGEWARRIAFAEALQLNHPISAFRWRVQGRFQQQKLRDYLDFDTTISSLIKSSTVLPLRLSIAMLFIMDSSFRDRVEAVCERLSNPELYEKVQKENWEDEIAEQERVMRKLQEEYERAKVLHENDEERHPDAGPPIYTSLRFTSVNTLTLDAFGIDYSIDTPDGHDILVKRPLPEWEQNYIFNHTAQARKVAEMKILEKQGMVTALEYDHKANEIIWYPDQKSKDDSKSWKFSTRAHGMPSSDKVLAMKEKEIALVGLWAANRAAMWLSAQDSRPLLSFVEDLDPFVYVL
ncbi:unnamed protein product [Clonostachys rosea]|uniref:Uncharacterized protein n=1 Tax=Bionectria ochroleuca TaxID=29856 RepID=A0ABY6U9V8_BIOOC|nr:unnamed protein product [Clonostachys rosea]